MRREVNLIIDFDYILQNGAWIIRKTPKKIDLVEGRG